MTTGALIFAFNNAEINYVTMAAWSAGNIQRHLSIPTSLVTDQINPKFQDAYDQFDRVIVVEKPPAGTRHFQDIEKTVDWFLNNEDWLQSVTSGNYQSYYNDQYGKR